MVMESSYMEVAIKDWLGDVQLVEIERRRLMREMQVESFESLVDDVV
jgi:hypothetical protein